MTTPGAPMEARAREVLWNAVFGWTGSDDAMTDRTVSAILNGLEIEGIEFATAPSPAAEEVRDPLKVAEEMRERCARACEERAQDFLLPEYALPQPIGSFQERFACGECATAIRALPLTGPQYRHVKRDTVYTVIGEAELQAATGALVDGSALLIYRGDDGKLWAREEGEFHDGRFVPLTGAGAGGEEG